MTIKRVSKKVFDTKIPDSASGDKAEILHLLRERVKELTALHSAAKILQNDGKPLPDIFRRILALLPPAWQYPDVTAARISFDGAVWTTKNFRQSSWRQRAVFRTEEGRRGEIEIAYLEQRPQEAEGPFLSEERYLINSIAEMLCSYAERKAAQLTILRAKDNLEIRVRQRTAELEMLNETLVQEISTRRKKERKIRAYQERLRRMMNSYFDNMSVRAKMLLLGAVFTAGFLVVGIISIVSINRVKVNGPMPVFTAMCDASMT